MSNIFNIANKNQIVFECDEWAEIGVHLETRMAQGMSIDEAISSLLVDGLEVTRVQQYVGRIGIKDGYRLEEVEELYTKEENAIIQRWILRAPYQPDARDDSAAIANRVAEIVLLPVRTSLPQWMGRYNDGRLATSRVHQLKALRKRDGLLEPIFLFEINWADSGPGISWPESYYLTLLPGYKIFVLTASQESDEVHGYTDLALAHIPYRNDVYIPLEEALGKIGDWWTAQMAGWSQDPWDCVWATGQFSPDELTSLRDEIWADWSM
jgi:hypothetical protein